MWHKSTAFSLKTVTAAACPVLQREKQELLSYPETKERDEDPSGFRKLSQQLSEENTSLSNSFHPFIFSSIKALISPIPKGTFWLIITQLSPPLRTKAQYLFCMQLKVGCAEITGHGIKKSCKCWLNIFVDAVELKYHILKKKKKLTVCFREKKSLQEYRVFTGTNEASALGRKRCRKTTEYTSWSKVSKWQQILL